MLKDNYFKKLWKIYVDSFPPEERRSLGQQKQIMKNEKYNIIPFSNDDELIGFLAYWDLADFIFIEHFAFSSKVRGHGYGSRYLKQFLKTSDKLVVLEVEPESDEITLRRIDFYNRLGFELNKYDYCQPAFDENKKPVVLQLMTYRKKLKYNEFQSIKEKLYRDIYNIKG